MNQPTKDVLREQLALAADEIIRLRGEIEYRRVADRLLGITPTSEPRKPWWRRLFS